MRRSFFLGVDWKLLAPVAVLILLSLATLSSMSTPLARNQLFSLIPALLAFFVFSQLNYQVLRWYGPYFYGISLGLLLLVLFIGFQSRGAVRWLDIFGVSVQFSEILKPFLALSLASFLARRQPSFATLARVAGLVMPIGLLILLQPDLGNVIVYLITVAIAFLVFGFGLLWFLLCSVVLVAAFPLIWRLMHEYQRHRLLTFLNPSQDPLGTSYNAIQSMVAVGSGMLFGKGLLESTQSGLRFLPERHSDFIFAAISEGLGFVGSLLVCACFAFLLYRIYALFMSVQDLFAKTFVLVSFTLILVQFFFNVGMNVGIVPVVGITLPFMSYGGSSLVSNFILLGLLSSISRISHTRSVLEIG